MKILRITRHPADEARINFLKKVYGEEVEIVDRDIRYGDKPVETVKELIKKEGDVVAIEAIGPFPIIMKLVDARLSVPFLRAEFKRDENGRAVVVGQDETGRDILAFGRYVQLVRIVFETEEGISEFINPRIVKKSRRKEVMEEGCLSFPSLFLKVKRSAEIEVEGLDKKGKKVKAEGLLARILQHEIDHLDGILFIDRISFWQKWKAKRKLKK